MAQATLPASSAPFTASVPSRSVPIPLNASPTPKPLLPGVGHYSAFVRALDEQNLRAPLLDAIHRGVPFLGDLPRPAGSLRNPAKKPRSSRIESSPGIRLFASHDRQTPAHGLEPASVQRAIRVFSPASNQVRYFYFAHSFAVTDVRRRGLRKLQRTARNSPPSSKSKTSSPCNFIRRRAATRARAFFSNFLRLAA